MHMWFCISHFQVADVDDARTLLDVGVDRIGHGTCLWPKRGGDDSLVEKVRQNQTALGERPLL